MLRNGLKKKLNNMSKSNTNFQEEQTKKMEALDEIYQTEEEEAEEDVCPVCNGDGWIEETGDGDNFECDAIGEKPCPECNED